MRAAIRLGVSVYVLGLLFQPGVCRGQKPQSTSEAVGPTQADDNSTGAVRLLYTGRLMGHFRIPDVQGPDSTGDRCSPNDPAESVAVTDFESALGDKALAAQVQQTLLVGAGDNFAPEVEARSFCKSKGRISLPGLSLAKQDYTWDQNMGKWCPNQDVNPNNRAGCSPGLSSLLASGMGTIPADNVGRFFIEEEYAALVPGKHDFYFGAERLRELARYLASTPIPGHRRRHLDSVQMLGGNLVVETNWKDKHKTLPDSDRPPWFIPGFPAVQDLLGMKLSDLDRHGLLTTKLKFSGVSDGGTVYPWFLGVSVKVAGPDPDALLVSGLKGVKAFICSSSIQGDPNAVPPPGKASIGAKQCTPLSVTVRGNAPKFQFPSATDSNLKPDGNYAFCMDVPKSDLHDAKGTHFYCVRFSVYIPLFQSRWGQLTADSEAKISFKEPDPYVLIPPTDSAPAVAIFGALDPHLTEYVGLLNTSWNNLNKKYTTAATIKDPAESLRQLLDYFDAQHPEFRDDAQGMEGKSIAGRRLFKVLLAQMSPQQAQILATRIAKFDVVVSAADPNLATVDHTIRTKITNLTDKHGPYPVFLAVPEPYYVSNRAPEGKSQWIPDIGVLTIESRHDEPKVWEVLSQHIESTINSAARAFVAPPNKFWENVAGYIDRNCLTHLPPSKGPAYALPVATEQAQKNEQIGWLTACIMERQLGADVVLLQKRDLFVDLPYSADGKRDSLQQFLDRLVWKGDFLKLLYVPGSTLQAVLKQSKAYDADDASELSLLDEKGRGLIVTGLRHDSETDTDLINEVPVDTTRLYAVATTDFVGAGDTGYPDLTNAAVQKLAAPRDFDKEQYLVSGLVCGRLAPSFQNPQSCNQKEDLINLADDIKESPSNSDSVYTARNSLWAWTIFDHKKHVPGTRNDGDYVLPPERAEWAIERRPLGSTRINPPDATLFALNEAALNLNVTNHKFSDAVLSQTFVGTPVPQLSAKRSHILGYDLQPQILYSKHRFQLFEKTEERYNIQYTGQNNAPRTVNQKENLFSSDSGIGLDFWNRELPHLEVVGAFHYETQLVHPTTETLAPLPKGSTFAQPTDTSRTHYLLPRFGLRYGDDTSWAEAGFEDGDELNAVRISLVSPPPAGGPQYLLKRTDISASGTYWKWHLVVPFSQTVAWTIDEDGDFFFNQHGDAQTDTRFRSDSKSSVNFQVFPSLSFAPTYEFFYYANKVQQTWFWLGQASIEMKFRFDFWNYRHKMDQLKFKPPQASSK